MLAALAFVAQSGSLFLAGGGTTPPEIVEAFFKACGGKGARILVLPLASAEPDDGSQRFLVDEHGATNVGLFAKDKPSPEDLDGLAKDLEKVKGVWMPGGVQGRIIERLGKVWCDEHIKPLLKRGVNFYGTSAGSMVCSATMILGPGKEPNTAETGPGLALTRWIVDTHFKQRDREGRLRDALRTTGLKRGVGINEREWIVIRDDRIVERHGEPTVIEN